MAGAGPVRVLETEPLPGNITRVVLAGPEGATAPYVGDTGSSTEKTLNVGYYSSVDKDSWRINTTPVEQIEKSVYTRVGSEFASFVGGVAFEATGITGPFDGTVYSSTGGFSGGYTGTGFISRGVTSSDYGVYLSAEPNSTTQSQAILICDRNSNYYYIDYYNNSYYYNHNY